MSERPRRKMTLLRLLLGSVLLAILGGCASASTLAGREYLSTALSDAGRAKTLVAGTRIRVRFDGSNISASAGCNSMGAAYRIDGGRLVTDSITTTAMGCGPDLGAQDEWLMTLLSSRPTLQQVGDELVLEGDGKVLRLLDRRAADPDRQLAGTRWLLDSIITGDAVSSVPGGVTAGLVFKPDGTLDVDTGCNQGSATWKATGGGITFGALGLTKKACAQPQATVEAAIVAVLGQGAVSASIEADVLNLRAAGAGLGFRAS